MENTTQYILCKAASILNYFNLIKRIISERETLEYEIVMVVSSSWLRTSSVTQLQQSNSKQVF